MASERRTRLLILLASLLLGAGAGVVSSILTSTALDNYTNALLGDKGFTSIEPRKPNTNPLDYAEAINRAREVETRSLAVIASKTTNTGNVTRLIGPSDQSGAGIVVSANGWVLTTADQVDEYADPAEGADVWVRNTRYVISEMVEDTLTDFVLLKLEAASGLSPVGFGASEDSRAGDLVFAILGRGRLTSTSIGSTFDPILTGPQQAELYTSVWGLATATAPTGPIVSATGDLLAFATATGTLPLHHGEAFVQEVIRNGEPAHAALGAYVLDLAQIYNLDIDLTQGLDSGVLVIGPADTLAVPARTPAGLAGLRTNDIITAVDDEVITPDMSLAEILSHYDPGQSARLRVVRDGAALEITVTLGDADTLTY